MRCVCGNGCVARRHVCATGVILRAAVRGYFRICPGSATIAGPPHHAVGERCNANLVSPSAPYGTGAFDNGDGSFTLLLNHEISTSPGFTRAHGGFSAYVSKWIISKNNVAVLGGTDLMTSVYGWNTGTQASNAAPGTFNFSHFCSADLPDDSDEPQRVQQMVLAAFSRLPTPAELADANTFLAEQRALYGAGLLADEQSWADFAHVLFNVKEFICLN